MNPLVGIIMGSDSDLKIMQAAADILKNFNIPHEVSRGYYYGSDQCKRKQTGETIWNINKLKATLSS